MRAFRLCQNARTYKIYIIDFRALNKTYVCKFNLHSFFSLFHSFFFLSVSLSSHFIALCFPTFNSFHSIPFFMVPFVLAMAYRSCYRTTTLRFKTRRNACAHVIEQKSKKFDFDKEFRLGNVDTQHNSNLIFIVFQ